MSSTRRGTGRRPGRMFVLSLILLSFAIAPLEGASPLLLTVPLELPTLKTFTVAPADIDPASDRPRDPHFVALDPSVPPRGQLFLWLTGTGGPPSLNSLILRQAAANGFHTIGLAYQNEFREPDLCENNPDEGCYEKLRLEIIYGDDLTPVINVTRANSIVTRLTKLLTYLASRFPDEGWGAYLSGGAPRWDRIRLGGHSQGAGHAAIMTRDHDVARQCMMEGPVDLIGAPGAAQRRLPPWVIPVHLTPVERYYGFRHVHSSSPGAAGFQMAWSVFGIDRFGPPVDTDTVKPPYNLSHHLTTDARPIDDGRPNLTHRSLAGDRTTPKTPDGRPLFAPVWQYICFD